MTTTPENIQTIQRLMSQYGSAIRGSWGDIDGRQIQGDIDNISAALDATEPIDIVTYRNMLGICPYGFGHWTEFCDDCEHKEYEW